MPKRLEPKHPRWLVFIARGNRAERLEADTEVEAWCKACQEFGIRTDWQKRRVFVRRAPD